VLNIPNINTSFIPKFISLTVLSIILIKHSSAHSLGKSWDSAVSIANGYGLDDRGVGVWVPVGSRIFTSPCRPDQLRGTPSLLSNEYQGLFPRESSSQGVKLTTHLQLVSRSRKCGSTYPLPHKFSWRSVLLVNHGDNFTFYLTQFRVYCSVSCLKHILLLKNIFIWNTTLQITGWYNYVHRCGKKCTWACRSILN
jgi:hypothetical protein